jgi:hypothetical protein
VTDVPIHLRRSDENTPDIDLLTESLGTRVGLDGVLAHLNREAVRTKVPGRVVEWGFGWNESDAGTERWWPQGITTSADAGPVEERRLLITSWYAQGSAGNQGSRISVIDLETLQYRHVLLAVPRRDKHGVVRLGPLRAHAGGLVWCGPYLHVAGTRRGLFTCRLDDLLRLDSTEDGFGYRYVLPVRFAYDAHADRDTEPMRYSFLSLDRGTDPPQLLAGEYGVGDQTRRLVRFPLDPGTMHLAVHEDGTSRPTRLDEEGLGHMQGAALVGDTYYVTSSRGTRTPGNLHVGRPGSWQHLRRSLPVGPEDITYWPETDTFWSLSEHPGHRYVFAVRRAAL